MRFMNFCLPVTRALRKPIGLSLPDTFARDLTVVRLARTGLWADKPQPRLT